MRVALDSRGLNTRFVRGMGEYIEKLIVEVGRRHEVSWLCYGNRPDLPFHSPPGGEIAQVRLTDVPGNRFHAWEQIALPWLASRDRADLLHCTMTTLPLWQPLPTVVTIHDTVQWHEGEDLTPGLYRDRLLPMAFGRCRAIITISENSRRDILRLWPGLDPKVHVIHHGITSAYLDGEPGGRPTALHAAGVERPYLLYVGGDIPRKRLDWTIELFAEMGRSDIALVVVGLGPAGRDAFAARLPEALRGQVFLMPFIAEDEMPALYANALAVVYPTLYEGFGLPALKAQAMGTPILLSAVSSLLELVGPTSFALPPDDRAAWLETCRRIVAQRSGGCAPDMASRRWAQRFNTAATADAHWRVYRQAVGLQPHD